jgi:putative PIN family toxin of toxin-antitoxin system
MPAALLRRWFAGEFELVISDHLLDEFTRVCDYPKIHQRMPVEAARRIVAILRGSAATVADPSRPPRRSSDPGDDYLLALAEAGKAALVSGDEHLLSLSRDLPVYSPRRFSELLDKSGRP